jgi:hypothetical protein
MVTAAVYRNSGWNWSSQHISGNGNEIQCGASCSSLTIAGLSQQGGGTI